MTASLMARLQRLEEKVAPDRGPLVVWIDEAAPDCESKKESLNGLRAEGRRRLIVYYFGGVIR